MSSRITIAAISILAVVPAVSAQATTPADLERGPRETGGRDED